MNSVIDEIMNNGIICYSLSLVFQIINLIIFMTNRKIIYMDDTKYEKIMNEIDTIKNNNSCRSDSKSGMKLSI
jgi:hypothetical protein